jgi:hypothetical protein
MNRVVAGIVLLVSALTQASSAAGTLPTYGASQVLFNLNRPPVVSATADFNCDGRMDVLVANGDGSSTTYPVTIVLADGHGSFVDGTSQVVVGSPHQTTYPSGIVLADFNGDGRADVFIPDQASQSDGSAGYQNTLLLSTPDCHLTDGTAGIPQQQDFSWGAAAANVDSDGDVDLIVVNDWGPSPPVPMQLWLNDGAGHFSIAQGALPAVFTDVNQIGVIGYKASAFVDVNGDGFVDLVLGADFRTASSVVLLNDGSGHFTQLANAMPAKPFGTTDLVMDIKSADFNHDGKPDLALAERIHSGPRGRWLQILVNNGDGTFRDETAQRLPQSDNTLAWFASVDIVDIDGDGNVDLAGQLAFGVGGQLFAVGDANGFFTPVPLGGSLDAVFSLVDVNGNGHRDILSAATTRISLTPNTGPVLPPGVPQQVRARSLPDRVRLTWPYVWGATSYQVWRSASAGSAGSPIGTATALTFDDIGATGTPMYYSVRAVNSAATSAASASVGGSTATTPAVVTLAATAIGPFGATLNATVNPHGSSASALFQYGYTTAYGTQVAASAPGSATSPVAVSAPVTGLSCNSTYHVIAKATSAGGIGTGADLTFTTSPCPSTALRPHGAWVDLAWQPAGDVDYLIDKMVAAGVQSVRMAFRWYMFEPVKGQWSFGVHDQIVAKLRARGIEILGLLQHPPTWAQGSGPPGITPPLNDSDWQAFISQIATHYRGQVANWEIWNEENLFAFWSPHPDAVRYVQLLKIAFNTIRSADPNATVVLGGLGNNGAFMGWEQPEERYYLQKIYDNGGKDYFDVLNVHIYVHPVTEGLSGLQGYLNDTRTVMAANGDAGKRLWLTETGWSLTPNGFTPNITETDQARLLMSLFAGRASLGLERIYWFSFRDVPADDDAYGMIRRNLTLRPSYYAYMGMTAPRPFTDSVLSAGSGVIRAVHITELRRRIDALRVGHTLAPYAWTDPTITERATGIKAQHILDLRTALSQAYVARGLAPPAYTDPSLGVGISIRVAHVAQIRAAVIAIE